MDGISVQNSVKLFAPLLVGTKQTSLQTQQEMADDTAQRALYRKRKVLEEVDVHPADYFAVADDASLIGESALLLGRLVDAVGDEGSEGSIHLLRCQVTYLKSKVDDQCTINDHWQ